MIYVPFIRVTFHCHRDTHGMEDGRIHIHQAPTLCNSLCSFLFIGHSFHPHKSLVKEDHFTDVKIEAWATKSFLQGLITVQKRSQYWNAGNYADKVASKANGIAPNNPLLFGSSQYLGKRENVLPWVRSLVLFFQTRIPMKTVSRSLKTKRVS